VNSDIQDRFRQEIAAAWQALQSSPPESEEYRGLFVRYCRLLHAASIYNTEGKLPDHFPEAGLGTTDGF
jgi:hypothetical protein